MRKQGNDIDYSQLPDREKKKLRKYYQRQLKKHPDVAIVDIHMKMAKKFNIKWIE